MSDVIKRGGIVVKFDNPNNFPEGIRMFREIQPGTPVVVLMEDIEAIIEYWSESEVLNILDGVNRVDKVVFLATTNYPEKLGGRIVNRPSRFDKRFKVGHPSEASRKVYLEHLVAVGGKKLKIDIKKWVKDTENMSISHIKELFTAVMIIGDRYEDAITTLQSMKEEKPSSDDDKLTKLGFSDD
jgi:SpoVK/Ycf46/Vps4 family AAA+-type ATPase